MDMRKVGCVLFCSGAAVAVYRLLYGRRISIGSDLVVHTGKGSSMILAANLGTALLWNMLEGDPVMVKHFVCSRKRVETGLVHTLVTSQLTHVEGNSLFLDGVLQQLLGGSAEVVLGTRGFLALYFASGAAGLAAACSAQQSPRWGLGEPVPPGSSASWCGVRAFDAMRGDFRAQVIAGFMAVADVYCLLTAKSDAAWLHAAKNLVGSAFGVVAFWYNTPGSFARFVDRVRREVRAVLGHGSGHTMQGGRRLGR